MRKITIVLALFLNLFTGHAQNADMRIYELVNSSNWFILAKEYPQLKDSIQIENTLNLAKNLQTVFNTKGQMPTRVSYYRQDNRCCRRR